MADETKPGGGNGSAPETLTALAESRRAGSLSAAFEILSDGRRRVALAYLSESDGEVHPVDAVVDHVRRVERRVDPDPAGHRERIATDLHHVHLPKLMDDGIVEYDTRTGTIRYRGGDDLERHLELAMERP